MKARVLPGDDVSEIASLFAMGYHRLLAARKAAQDRQNPLDSLDEQSDELDTRSARRTKLA